MSFFWDDTNELTYDSYTKESESFDFSAVLVSSRIRLMLPRLSLFLL
jgi:hypothetical protein